MNAAEIQQLVDASVARALAAKDQEIANAIAEGLRTYADRPVGEKGAPSLQFGVVEQVNDTYAYVTLDGQTDAVPINMLGGLVEGERVAVMLVPPSGNLAIGMVTPSTPSPGVPPGGTTGQVLEKASNVDFDDVWATISAGSGFPVGPEDNATTTASIVHATSSLTTKILSDAAPTTLAETLASVTTTSSTLIDFAITAAGETASNTLSAFAGGAQAILSADAGTGSGSFKASSNGTQSSAEITTDKLSFHGATPVVQAATPTTLGDVITILQDLGLCA